MKIRISGWGASYSVVDLTVERATDLLDAKIHTEDEFESFNDECAGHAFGFFADAELLADDHVIASVGDLIEKHPNHPRHAELLNNIDEYPLTEISNAWVRVDGQQGDFAEFESEPTTNYNDHQNLINDLLNNLRIETGGLFSLPTWNNGEQIECDPTVKNPDYFVIYKGDWFEYEITDEDDDD